MSRWALDLKVGLDDILATLRSLPRPHLSPPALSAVEAVEQGARRLTTTVQEILAATDIDQGDVASGLTSVDVRPILVSLAAENSLAGRAVEVRPLPECSVLADPGLLEQALWNVVVHVHEAGDPPVRIEVEVGPAMASISLCDRTAALEGMAGVKPLGADQASDLGLAVTLATQLIESWGGQVLASGHGAAIQLRLPLAQPGGGADAPSGAGTPVPSRRS
jgi:K+-sensing histidine kinase KdpD